jgi:aldehyde:ferredoxin oxidoreductase
MDAIIAASQICDEFGVDTITAGLTISFAMECYEKGMISKEDTEGIQMRFGNHEAMITMLKKMVTNEGFGKKLREGTSNLSKMIPGSEGFAMHSKGLEFGGYECRGLNGQALQFAIDNRGGCHHGYGLLALSESTDGSHCDVEGKGNQVRAQAIERILCDSLVFCTFPGCQILTLEVMKQALSSVFGRCISIDELDQVGERIMCQERLFNMREGISRKDDLLPKRLLTEPKSGGVTKGCVVPLEMLKDEYYEAMDWDLSTGNPSDAGLDKLGIKR